MRALLAVPLMMAISLSSAPVQAHAITRSTVLKRANHWIAKRVRYSQHSYYRGYRRDCSGFVSMAWKLKRSYTSSSIRHTAKRISWRALKPGDAVRRPGHVEIFGGWKNKRKRLYIALEETGRGKPAVRRVKKFRRGSMALRYRGIRDDRVARPVVTTPVPPSTTTTPTPTVDASVTPTPSVDATASASTSFTLTPVAALSIL